MPRLSDLVRRWRSGWTSATEFLAARRTKLHVLCALAALALGRPCESQDLVTALLLIAGLSLRVWALGCISKNRVLCTWGPYRYCRNPLYLGNALIGAGLCVLANHWAVTLLWVTVFAVAYPPTIRREEAALAQIFGAAYADYCAITPRFFPGLRRAGARPGEGFRLAHALRQGLVAQGIGFILLVGVIEAKEEYLEARGALLPPTYGVIPLSMLPDAKPCHRGDEPPDAAALPLAEPARAATAGRAVPPTRDHLAPLIGSGRR